jgi:hypothetical protein
MKITKPKMYAEMYRRLGLGRHSTPHIKAATRGRQLGAHESRVRDRTPELYCPMLRGQTPHHSFTTDDAPRQPQPV